MYLNECSSPHSHCATTVCIFLSILILSFLCLHFGQSYGPYTIPLFLCLYWWTLHSGTLLWDFRGAIKIDLYRNYGFLGIRRYSKSIPSGAKFLLPLKSFLPLIISFKRHNIQYLNIHHFWQSVLLQASYFNYIFISC